MVMTSIDSVPRRGATSGYYGKMWCMFTLTEPTFLRRSSGVVLALSLLLSCSSSRERCSRNADCEGSDAAEELSMAKCPRRELYCREEACVGACADSCELARTDTNPCQDGAICVVRVGKEPSDTFCSMLPVACASDTDCPAYRPLLANGAQGMWTCVSGHCAYPDFSYATK